MALFPLLFFLARSLFAPRLELMAKILALRQQPAILNRTTERPSLRFQDRLFWTTLSRFWRDWRSALLIVKPEAVIKFDRVDAGLALITKRRQTSLKEPAWRDQIDSSEQAIRQILGRWPDFAGGCLPCPKDR